MTDPRTPPGGPPVPRGESFEVPLIGDTAPSHDAVPSDTTAPTNRRRRGVLIALGGVALTIVAAAVLPGVVADRGDESETSDGDPPTDDLGLEFTTAISTPPTLAPLPSDPTGSPIPARDGSLLDEVTVPTFPLAAPGTTSAPEDFDLIRAVDRLGADVARQSTTTLALGVGGYQRAYSIVRDPASERYGATLDQLVTVVDERTGVTYLDISSPDDERWIQTDNTRVAESFGVETLDALFQQLLQGPVRVDTIGSATVTPGELVVLDDNTTARAFTVRLPGRVVPEWQLYAFGPTDEFLPSDRPTQVEYTVYVDERNEVRRIVGLSDLGGIPQLIVHDIELLADPVRVDLPNSALIDVDPADATNSDETGSAA